MEFSLSQKWIIISGNGGWLEISDACPMLDAKLSLRDPLLTGILQQHCTLSCPWDAHKYSCQCCGIKCSEMMLMLNAN
jgi:hypothetical protein